MAFFFWRELKSLERGSSKRREWSRGSYGDEKTRYSGGDIKVDEPVEVRPAKIQKSTSTSKARSRRHPRHNRNIPLMNKRPPCLSLWPGVESRDRDRQRLSRPASCSVMRSFFVPAAPSLCSMECLSDIANVEMSLTFYRVIGTQRTNPAVEKNRRENELNKGAPKEKRPEIQCAKQSKSVVECGR